MSRRLAAAAAVLLASALVLAGAPAAVAAPVPVPAGAGTSAYAWGTNSSGQLGDGTFTDRTQPFQVPGLGDVRQVAGTSSGSLALRADGTVWAWGSNRHSQLGLGAGIFSAGAPTQVPNLFGVVKLAALDEHAFAITGDGSLWAWGDNPAYVLGDGTQIERTTPTRLTLLGGPVVSVATNHFHTVAARADGVLLSWGQSLIFGQPTQQFPVQLIGPPPTVQVATGGGVDVALHSNGTVSTWGSNPFGELGTGSTSPATRLGPAPVPGLGGVTQIAAGEGTGNSNLLMGGFVLAVAGANDAVWAWGVNQDFEIGDGTGTNRFSPVPNGLTGVSTISAGLYKSAAVTNNGTVYTWGQPLAFGLGARTPRAWSLPNQFGTNGPGVAISASGFAHFLVAGISAVTVPDLRNLNLTSAQAGLAASYLHIGTVTNQPDPLCDHIGKVWFQSPSPGVVVGPGSAVNLTFGQRTGPCR